MRKIERLMIDAVKNCKDWRLDNTEVLYSPSRKVSCVYLHKNLIATISEDDVEVYDGGWQSTLRSHASMLSSTDCVMVIIKVCTNVTLPGTFTMNSRTIAM